MNNSIKKINALALTVSMTFCGVDKCVNAQMRNDVPPTPMANRLIDREQLSPIPFPNLDEFSDEPTNLDEFLDVPPTPVAPRHHDRGPFTPMRPLNFNADMPTVPDTPVANRVIYRTSLSPVSPLNF